MGEGVGGESSLAVLQRHLSLGVHAAELEWS